MDIFYLVWEPFSRQTNHRHECLIDAKDEAVRLAKKSPGKEFYVLKAIIMSKKDEPVKTIELTDLPF